MRPFADQDQLGGGQRNRQPLLSRDAIEGALAEGIDPTMVAAALASRENAPRRRRIGEVLGDLGEG